MDESAADSASPVIDPSFFDLIVVGTGLPESILAAGASSAGKSVLHLDSNPYYGSNFASLSFNSFCSFLDRCRSILPASDGQRPSIVSEDGELAVIELETRSLFSHIDYSFQNPEAADLITSRNFLFDISGPRLLFCADPTVDIMLKSGATHHLEFKSVEASFVYREGKLWQVPDSREAIFKDRSLGLTEKNQLMKFFKLVRGHIGQSAEEERRVSEEDLESPFVEFLQKQRLPLKIKSMILYAIAMADYDQEDPVNCKRQLKTKDGMESLALYWSSVGRFANAPGAFIYPMYGQGELPQAFCRCAAVKGSLYVLRMPVESLLLEKECGHYKGVRVGSGQDLFSHKLVIDPSFIIPQSKPSSSLDVEHEVSDFKMHTSSPNSPSKVARAVCVTTCSLQPGLLNLLVVFPPATLFPDQVTSVRAVQLSSNVSVCPPDMFLIYLSTLCEIPSQGRETLRAAINALFPPFDSPKRSAQEVNENAKLETKLHLLWSALYVHDLTEVLSDAISSCPMPDGNIGYKDLLKSTSELFYNMYPEEELFAEAVASENTEDDDCNSPE